MKKQLFLAILVAFFSLLIAFIVNILSDDVEQWLDTQLWNGYEYWLIAILIVLFIAAAILADWKSLFSKASAEKITSMPDGISPNLEDETVDETTYRAIETALRKSLLDKGIALMRQIPSKSEIINRIEGRFNDLERRKNIGDLSASDIITLENQIRNSLWDEFNKLPKPVEKPKIPVAPQAMAIQYIFKIASDTDRKLAFSRNFIGRAEDLKRFFEKRAEAGGHCMVVTGTGGMGKTDFCKAILKKIISENPAQAIY